MFGVNWNDPQTWWLNVTNVALGILTVACGVLIARAILREVLRRR